MTIHTKPLYRFLATIGLIATLAACGSGGGDDKDSTPDSFTITPVTDAAVSTEVTSSAVTLAGFNQDVSISITGGSYSIAGGAFTTVAGTVSSGKSVAVKVTASSATNTLVEAVLTVGGVTGNFKVTTKPDVTPNTFSFTAATDVVPKSVNASAAITVAGIDIAVPISVTGGEYAIGTGEFTSTAGTVSKNQTVKVRGTAASTTNAGNNVELTIGGVKGTYAITTLADTVSPTAQILFPPVVSMTESNTILVRGTASDDYNTIASLKVNGVTATSTDGFKNWQALVPLKDTAAVVTATTENTLTVTTEDSVGNKSPDAAHVAIRQAPHNSHFPDADNPFSEAFKMVIDKTDNRNRLLATSGYYNSNIMSVDLATGKRSIFKQFQAGSLEGSDSIQLDPVTKRLYISANNFSGVGQIIVLDLSTAEILASSPFYGSVMTGISLDTTGGESKIIAINGFEPASIVTTNSNLANFTILSDATHPNSEALIADPTAITLDKIHDRYLVSDCYQEVGDQAIFAINKSTGARSVLSSNLVGNGDLFAPTGDGYIYDLAIDEINQRAIVVEGGYEVGGIKGISRVFAVDLITGNRSILSTTSSTNPENSIEFSRGLILNASENIALVSGGGIFAVDLITGKRVVVSR